jgi:SAM-dependent methyltransferase
MGEDTSYVIRGGIQGRERLRVLSRIVYESTARVLDRVGPSSGMTVLDAGCGGGDVTLELARRVGLTGKVVGVDMDATKIELARAEAAARGVTNVEYVVGRADDPVDAAFDMVYARFLLTHLQHPQEAVHHFHGCLRGGGLIALEDIDFSGAFVWPDSPAFRRHRELYCTAARLRGCDPGVGPRLPLFLRSAGCTDIGVSIAQPVGLEGEMKVINALTMENIADAVIGQGLADREEVDRITRELYEFAADPNTLAGTPRIVQVWGRKP